MLRSNKQSKHKIVALGDSIPQGFHNGGIYRTELGFPALLSRSLDPEFKMRLPSFTAQAGIPVNLEMLVRGLSDRFGENLDWNDYIPAATHLYSTLRRIKNYWESREGSASPDATMPYHNQGVWGFAMNDVWLMNEQKCREHIKNFKETYSIFDILPDHAMYITAGMVLNPSQSSSFRTHSQIDNARYLQEHGGIENLIVTAGHNNIMGAATNLHFKYSEKEDLNSFYADRSYTVYRPEHFEQEFRNMAEKVSSIGAERVITQTIPYVTIPPVTRGVNADLSTGKGGYFDYYTRFWIWDDDFDPGMHPHLTKEQAITLDQHVDSYNRVIKDVADEYGWLVVPLNKYVSAFAYRRLAGNIKMPYPEEFCQAMERHEETKHLVEDRLNPILSTQYLKIDEDTGKVRTGGIFSLDGIHPTTIGYGLIAYLYRETLKQHGVSFTRPIDWDFIIENDTLVTHPPRLLLQLKDLLHFLTMGRQEKLNKIGKSFLRQVMDMISPQSPGPKEEEAKS